MLILIFYKLFLTETTIKLKMLENKINLNLGYMYINFHYLKLVLRVAFVSSSKSVYVDVSSIK